jgi:hypothetical protein
MAICHDGFMETTMRLFGKMVFGAVSLLTATAASSPHAITEMYLGSDQYDLRKQEALKLCQATSQSFVRFLASDRDQCYHQMRGVGTNSTYSGVWSKPDRARMQLAQN